MRMMKNNRNETVMVIGIDHGYGNMKTATRCFPSGVASCLQWHVLPDRRGTQGVLCRENAG